MVGSFVLALVLVVLGLIGAVALPGAGWVLLPILVVLAILVVVRAFTGGRETTSRAPN
jgi:fatty acid desaturase